MPKLSPYVEHAVVVDKNLAGAAKTTPPIKRLYYFKVISTKLIARFNVINC